MKRMNKSGKGLAVLVRRDRSAPMLTNASAYVIVISLTYLLCSSAFAQDEDIEALRRELQELAEIVERQALQISRQAARIEELNARSTPPR